MEKQIEEQAVNAIRVLSADAIQKAKSGHPGLPLGAAPMAYELWAHHLKINPKNPEWEDRDRFILSAGHGSMLLYALLHLYGFGLTKEDLMDFRQLSSKTPGHPEYRHTAGVEATTGPLGAGLAMAVGMAAAEKHLAAIFNRPGFEIVNHRCYALCGDGCMMEGISSEALSLAGSWKLDKLTILYDSNGISIEGSTDLAFTEDVEKRVQAFGFKTLIVPDGNDLAAISRALETAEADDSAPYFIIVKTEIGYGCPGKQGSEKAHGEPLGEENIVKMKEFLHWPSQEPFYVPTEVYTHYRELAESKRDAERSWQRKMEDYRGRFPELYALWKRYYGREDEAALLYDKDFFRAAEKEEATRASSGAVLQILKERIPNLFGGSADLSPSTKTELKGEPYFSAENPSGRNLHFGVRELAMAGIANGILLHGGLRSYVGTFFVFSDYLKPMARLSALMRIPQIFVLTHDSIGVGEDGPTHEPVEQLAMLRAMPNFRVFRPCDRLETEAAWYAALNSTETPTALVLSRQNLPQLCPDGRKALKGAYILREPEKEPEYILIATGSELSLALEAEELLREEGYAVRVVSMPSMDLFEEQSEEYRESVLPRRIRKRLSLEALSTFGWERYTGLDGKAIGMESFGASAPAKLLLRHFGFTAERIAEEMKKL